jgi:hypothetical protein
MTTERTAPATPQYLKARREAATKAGIEYARRLAAMPPGGRGSVGKLPAICNSLMANASAVLRIADDFVHRTSRQTWAITGHPEPIQWPAN